MTVFAMPFMTVRNSSDMLIGKNNQRWNVKFAVNTVICEFGATTCTHTMSEILQVILNSHRKYNIPQVISHRKLSLTWSTTVHKRCSLILSLVDEVTVNLIFNAVQVICSWFVLINGRHSRHLRSPCLFYPMFAISKLIPQTLTCNTLPWQAAQC